VTVIQPDWVRQVHGCLELHLPAGVLCPEVQQAWEASQTPSLPQDRASIPEGRSYRGLDALIVGMLCVQARRLDRGRAVLEQACTDLAHPLVFNEAARLYSSLNLRSRAVDLRRRALAMDPGQAMIRANLGDDLVALGRTDEGLAALQEAAVQAPDDPVIHSMWLSSGHYQWPLDSLTLARRHRRWGRRFAEPPRSVRASGPRDSRRRLRIGYLSPDFCSHSVATFLEPLLDARNRQEFDVVGYGNVPAPDQVTERLCSKMDFYRNILNVSATQVAHWIRSDRIDILVDLCGHFRGNRLDVLALKPAPLQVTYLGYPNTTGLSQIDYRFTDSWSDTEDQESFYTERLWFLPQGFLCYRPPPQVPAVSALPLQQQGYVTFGCFNNNAKINEQVLRLWAQILHKVPQSKLILKFRTGQEPAVKERYALALQALGIGPERLELWGWLAPEAHWDLYRRIDLALDTYPYHGTTTTCEALWMGVPSLTLLGTHHMSRVGHGLLTRVGLEAFVAHSEQAYVDKAVSFVRQPEALATIRGALRRMMLGSSLCDAGRVCGGVEQAYRSMWQATCEMNV
jgi:tetratricopeptide (TPR) repeat protein